MTAGTAGNLSEALDQWENEREIIGQLHDENQAYSLAVRRFDVAMVLASKVIDTVERDAAMFITEKTRKEIQQFRDQLAKLRDTRTLAQDITLAPHGAQRSAGEETPTGRSKPHAKQAHTNP